MSCLGLKKDVLITSLYIPPCNSQYSSIELFDELDHFLLDYHDDCYYHIVCGDFNAHTGTAADVVHSSPYVLEDDDTDMRRMIDMYESMLQLGIPTETL